MTRRFAADVARNAFDPLVEVFEGKRLTHRRVGFVVARVALAWRFGGRRAWPRGQRVGGRGGLRGVALAPGVASELAYHPLGLFRCRAAKLLCPAKHLRSIFGLPSLDTSGRIPLDPQSHKIASDSF